MQRVRNGRGIVVPLRLGAARRRHSFPGVAIVRLPGRIPGPVGVARLLPDSVAAVVAVVVVPAGVPFGGRPCGKEGWAPASTQHGPLGVGSHGMHPPFNKLRAKTVQLGPQRVCWAELELGWLAKCGGGGDPTILELCVGSQTWTIATQKKTTKHP